jgi:hypothetical protein
MYVNPFWLGVGVTIGSEAILLIVAAVWAAMKR